ncbi:molybdopterin-guanine dinucleotide biosynthesis protein MobB [Siminovitchia terrae]|uniref:Molybdopterin-guanine dinucleotide biosynthesis protein B n=1 Tax=Siminovitchia terrae TaxID=1914933 RepID=A0A429X3F2_SIMTE|nr:molybdopterin-guanine dinucleotide biosynthesis protein B [Siminovitchia terrae]RST57908.1 molybdopterin-guanine dinucleotide biosynthesis protein B [Siminovitchia terrae]GIN91025.1 molybdopterin-guanine dinucleotide biosynthesis protein MobB [Siminovitchia terrae]GIN99249.1 molybdopterin-guanine dinucleotide biosynthesis protein MobB [Siminovitchia terrae]
MAGKKIIQIVGFQNSGKTTLIERLITACKEKKLAVGTIKHHGHGNAPDRIILNKDSEKHQQAGAIVTTVEGAGSLHLEAKKEHWELQDIIRMYEQLPVDIILVEGYKRMNYPKVVLVRNPQDEFLIEELTNIIAVISNKPLTCTPHSSIFRKDEMDRFISWFMNQINAAED